MHYASSRTTVAAWPDAIDDFGAGYAGLNLLADFQPDIVKLDMALTRDIDRDAAGRAIVSGIVGTAGADLPSLPKAWSGRESWIPCGKWASICFRDTCCLHVQASNACRSRI